MRCFLLSGRNPTNVNGAEKPLKQKAFKNALAPGIIEYFKPLLFSSATSSLPGSLMQGVPASVIKLMVLPCFRSSIIFGVVSL